MGKQPCGYSGFPIQNANPARINTLQSSFALLRYVCNQTLCLDATRRPMMQSSKHTPVNIYQIDRGSYMIKTDGKVTIIRFA